MLPLISCIIPIYNAEKYIYRCIESICNQTYTNVEVILVNDGSTDNSGMLCDKFATIYPNILVLHTHNYGASIARKKGLEISRGEYVCFLDSDDYVTPTYISSLFNLIIKYNTNISIGNVFKYKEGEQTHKMHLANDSYLLSFKELMPRFYKYNYWGFWGKLYKKEVFTHISFPTATLCEDYAVMTQIFSKEKNIAYTNEILYYYEIRLNSLSKQYLCKRAFDEFENVMYVYNYTCNNIPQYTDYALSNVIESSVKLYFMKVDDKDNKFCLEFIKIRNFLYNHKKQILSNPHISYKLKLLSLGLILIPTLTIKGYNFIKK